MTQSPMRTESAEAYVAMQQDLVHISGYLLKLTRDGKWQRRYAHAPSLMSAPVASGFSHHPDRWFETNGCFLTYYKSKKMTKLLAALNLPQAPAPRLPPLRRASRGRLARRRSARSSSSRTRRAKTRKTKASSSAYTSTTGTTCSRPSTPRRPRAGSRSSTSSRTTPTRTSRNPRTRRARTRRARSSTSRRAACGRASRAASTERPVLVAGATIRRDAPPAGAGFLSSEDRTPACPPGRARAKSRTAREGAAPRRATLRSSSISQRLM